MSRSRPLSSFLSITFTASALLGCATADEPDVEAREHADDAPTAAEVEALVATILEDEAASLVQDIDELWPDEPRVDDLGMAHTRLTQTLDDIPVFGATAIVHTDEHGAFEGLTDGLVHDLRVDTTPRLTEAEATDLAVEASGGWPSLSDDPQVELMVLRHHGRDHLTYRVQLRQMEPGREPARPVVFVDAHTGRRVWSYDDLHHWALQSSLHTVWDLGGSTKFAAAVVGDSSDATLSQAHDSVVATLKFLSAKAGRSSYDGAGTPIDAYGHYDQNYLNAFWDAGAQRLVLGDGDGVTYGPFGVPDIVAHEVGHGVIGSEAGLTNWGESGALAETTGDIMGAAVSDYIGDDWVFDIGEDCWLPADPSVAFRFMGHPSDDGSSRDHYSDRYVGNADNGGVHFNSGIGNHFFFLLAEGGQHHDPAFRSGLVVSGIGIEDAFQIWYRALTVYMVPSTDFAEARLATEKAADDLFGGSVVQQVSTAWFEVGVGGEPK